MCHAYGMSEKKLLRLDSSELAGHSYGISDLFAHHDTHTHTHLRGKSPDTLAIRK